MDRLSLELPCLSGDDTIRSVRDVLGGCGEMFVECIGNTFVCVMGFVLEVDGDVVVLCLLFVRESFDGVSEYVAVALV